MLLLQKCAHTPAVHQSFYLLFLLRVRAGWGMAGCTAERSSNITHTHVALARIVNKCKSGRKCCTNPSRMSADRHFFCRRAPKRKSLLLKSSFGQWGVAIGCHWCFLRQPHGTSLQVSGNLICEDPDPEVVQQPSSCMRSVVFVDYPIQKLQRSFMFCVTEEKLTLPVTSSATRNSSSVSVSLREG